MICLWCHETEADGRGEVEAMPVPTVRGEEVKVLGYQARAVTGIYQPCASLCYICDAPLPETAIEVRVTLDLDCHDDCDMLHTQIVCSEGCGVRFVSEHMGDSYDLSLVP